MRVGVRAGTLHWGILTSKVLYTAMYLAIYLLCTLQHSRGHALPSYTYLKAINVTRVTSQAPLSVYMTRKFSGSNHHES